MCLGEALQKPLSCSVVRSYFRLVFIFSIYSADQLPKQYTIVKILGLERHVSPCESFSIFDSWFWELRPTPIVGAETFEKGCFDIRRHFGRKSWRIVLLEMESKLDMGGLWTETLLLSRPPGDFFHVHYYCRRIRPSIGNAEELGPLSANQAWRGKIPAMQSTSGRIQLVVVRESGSNFSSRLAFTCWPFPTRVGLPRGACNKQRISPLGAISLNT